MNTLPRRCKYALRALYHLAREYQQGPVLIATLAREERIPRKFLEGILLQLKTAGILDSKKGRQGGYFLRLPPQQVTLGKIVRLLDGPLAPLPCASENAAHACADCPDRKFCETRIIMRRVRDSISEVLDNTTLAMASAGATAETVSSYEI
jgi:Rrf2 family protein